MERKELKPIVINGFKFYEAFPADAVMDAMELQHKADAELIAADRRNMDAMKERIKELECEIGYYKPHSRFLDSECDKYVATIQQLETRIKELETVKNLKEQM